MQNTSKDTKRRYKLILRSILILECDLCFSNFNLKLQWLPVTRALQQFFSHFKN